MVEVFGPIDYGIIAEKLEVLRRITEIGLDTGTATSGTSTTLEDTTKDWGTDQWKNAYVEITDGTGKGQIRKIVSNTSTTLTVSSPWTTPPDSTSKYRIFGAPSEVSLLSSIDSKVATETTLSTIKNALQSVGTDKILTVPDNPPNLDVKLSTRASESTLSTVSDRLYDSTEDKSVTAIIKEIRDKTQWSRLDNLDITLSAHLDGLKPTRATPEQVLTSYSIAAGGTAEFTVSGADGYSAVVVTVKAAYDPSATAGVRVRWLYSPDNTNFDSPEDAESAGNYEDLTFAAGVTRTRTILIPLYQPYVKVQIANQDATYAVTVDAWKTLMR